MKLISTLAAFILVSSIAFAVDLADVSSPRITVTGTVITEVTPDRLVWSLSLKNSGLELAKVAERHATVSADVLKALKELGIEDKDVQTAQMEFGENMVYREREHVKEGYFASTMIAFKLADLAKYKEVWLRLASMSHLSVNSVTYDHSRRVELQKETRKKALLAAKEKAGVMAETLEAKIGEVLAISEDMGSDGDWNNRGNLNVNNSIQSISAAGDGETAAPLLLAPSRSACACW
jgi:uncharacterized protein